MSVGEVSDVTINNSIINDTESAVVSKIHYLKLIIVKLTEQRSVIRSLIKESLLEHF